MCYATARLLADVLPLEELIDRCRHLALLARHPAMRVELMKLAAEIEGRAKAIERQGAAETEVATV